jgi:hypothetical protein
MYRFQKFQISVQKLFILAMNSKLKTKLHGLSLRTNYTDRATAACRRSECKHFADRGCHVVSVTDPYGCILDFPDRSRYFYEVAPQLYSRGCVDPVPDPLLIFLVVRGIEHGP